MLVQRDLRGGTVADRPERFWLPLAKCKAERWETRKYIYWVISDMRPVFKEAAT
jgi:hypothetical protein